MSDSQVIARKFRPKTFDQVVGQEAITRTLSNSITSDRLHHAYLFAGARGVGKTTTARIFAKSLNCIKGITPEPCGECASCREIASSSSIDVLEIDAATHTQVDNIREIIINTIQIAPARDRYKIFIIDEVHQLSGASFNALLKTLEEPPPRVAFIMATTEMHKVPETILSRCQIFEFRTITLKKIFDQLRHIADELKVKISDAALLAIARAGEGSMRDAESALDQVISFAGLEVADEDVSAALGLVDLETLNVTIEAISRQDALEVLRIVDDVVSRGSDLRNFCREMMEHMRALLVAKIAGFDAELLQLPPGEGERIAKLAESFSEQDLVRFFSLLTKTEQDIRISSHPRLQLEMGLMKLVHAGRLYLLEDALNHIQELQTKLNTLGVLPSGEAPAKTAPPREPAKPSSGLGRSGPRPIRESSRPANERPFKPVTSAPAASSRPVIPDEPEPDSPSRKAGLAPSRPDNEVADSYSPFARNPLPVAKAAAPEPPPAGEPPTMFDDPYESEEPMEPEGGLTDRFSGGAGKSVVEKIKAALEARRKMILVSMLDKADSIEVDGEVLRISFAPGSALYKNKIESRDNRQLIEEVCREAVGRRLTMSVTMGPQAKTGSAPEQKKPVNHKKQAETNPAIQALADKFHGEIIEVVKPDN